MKENTLREGFSARHFLSAFGLPLVVCCLLVLPGCKTKKQLVARTAAADSSVVPGKPVVDTKLVAINAIKSAQTYFNTFSGKAKAKLDINGDENDVTLNIRIQRDKKIWVSVTAIAGIEVARALITPDSILLMNRLQSIYLKKPFSYVAQFAGNKVNYKTLESLLVGNAIPEALNENSDIKTTTAATTLTGRLASLVYVLTLGPDNKVNQLNLNDQDAGQTMQVNNSAYAQAGAGKIMPLQVDMSSTVKSKKITVNLHYTKEEFDQPLEYPFTIPARYVPGE